MSWAQPTTRPSDGCAAVAWLLLNRAGSGLGRAKRNGVEAIRGFTLTPPGPPARGRVGSESQLMRATTRTAPASAAYPDRLTTPLLICTCLASGNAIGRSRLRGRPPMMHARRPHTGDGHVCATDL